MELMWWEREGWFGAGSDDHRRDSRERVKGPGALGGREKGWGARKDAEAMVGAGRRRPAGFGIERGWKLDSGWRTGRSTGS